MYYRIIMTMMVLSTLVYAQHIIDSDADLLTPMEMAYVQLTENYNCSVDLSCNTLLYSSQEADLNVNSSVWWIGKDSADDILGSEITNDLGWINETGETVGNCSGLNSCGNIIYTNNYTDLSLNVSALTDLQIQDRTNISALTDFTQDNRDNISILMDRPLDTYNALWYDSGDYTYMNTTNTILYLPYGQIETLTYVEDEIPYANPIKFLQGLTGNPYIMFGSNSGVNSYMNFTTLTGFIKADGTLRLDATQLYITPDVEIVGDLAVNGDDISSDGNLNLDSVGNIYLNPDTITGLNGNLWINFTSGGGDRNIQFRKDDGSYISFFIDDSQSDRLRFYDYIQGGDFLQYLPTSGALTLFSNGGGNIILSPDGGDILPISDSSIDLGSTSLTYNSIWTDNIFTDNSLTITSNLEAVNPVVITSNISFSSFSPEPTIIMPSNRGGGIICPAPNDAGDSCFIDMGNGATYFRAIDVETDDTTIQSGTDDILLISTDSILLATDSGSESILVSDGGTHIKLQSGTGSVIVGDTWFPDTDNTYDIGLASLAYREMFAYNFNDVDGNEAEKYYSMNNVNILDKQLTVEPDGSLNIENANPLVYSTYGGKTVISLGEGVVDNALKVQVLKDVVKDLYKANKRQYELVKYLGTELCKKDSSLGFCGGSVDLDYLNEVYSKEFTEKYKQEWNYIPTTTTTSTTLTTLEYTTTTLKEGGDLTSTTSDY